MDYFFLQWKRGLREGGIGDYGVARYPGMFFLSEERGVGERAGESTLRVRERMTRVNKCVIQV